MSITTILPSGIRSQCLAESTVFSQSKLSNYCLFIVCVTFCRGFQKISLVIMDNSKKHLREVTLQTINLANFMTFQRKI